MESYTVLSHSAVVCESPLLTLLDCPDTEKHAVPSFESCLIVCLMVVEVVLSS